MKLRNKKTGEIIEGKCFTDIINILDEQNDIICRSSLLNVDLFKEYWEEIPMYEPYIKDEKIRKIIRAWAKINDASVLTYNADENSLRDIFRNEIYFNQALGLKDGDSYSVSELCGK